MQPRDFFEQIELPNDLTHKGLKTAIKANIRKIYFGGLSRSAFETAVFTTDMKTWPLGHLQDHRISIPEKLASQLELADEDEIADVLGRFLYIGSVPHAREMISQALTLNPKADARVMVDLRSQSAQLFNSLIRGRLDDTYRFARLKQHPWKETRSAMRLMLLYYSAIELQMIAQRARAMARFGFGVTHKHNGPTLGGLLSGWDEIVSAIDYTVNAARQCRPVGRAPRLVTILNTKVEKWAAQQRKSEDELAPAVERLLIGTIKPILAQIEPAMSAWQAVRTDKPSLTLDSTSYFRKTNGARQELTTFHDTRTTGEQVAFASLRIENLITHAFDLLPPRQTKKSDFMKFNGRNFRAGANGPALRLYLVCQSAIIEDVATIGFQKNLFQGFNCWANHDTGGKASAQLKTVRAHKEDFLNERNVVSLTFTSPLKGCQFWDILPDYRLGIRSTSLSETAGKGRRKKPNDLPNHTQKHGLYKAPRRAPRA